MKKISCKSVWMFAIATVIIILIAAGCGERKITRHRSSVPSKPVLSVPVEPATVIPILVGKSRTEANRLMGITPTRTVVTDLDKNIYVHTEAHFEWIYEDYPLKSFETHVDFSKFQSGVHYLDLSIKKSSQLKTVRYVYCRLDAHINPWTFNDYPRPNVIVPQKILAAKPDRFYTDDDEDLLVCYHLNHRTFFLTIRQPGLIIAQRNLNTATGAIKTVYRLNPDADWRNAGLAIFEQFGKEIWPSLAREEPMDRVFD